MPIERTQANTRAVFGDGISVYDILLAVAETATLPIYFTRRISKIVRNTGELPKPDAQSKEITEGEWLTKKERLKTRWAALDTLVGASIHDNAVSNPLAALM